MMELSKHLKYQTTLREFIVEEIGHLRGARIAHCYLCGHNHYDFGTSSLMERAFCLAADVSTLDLYTHWLVDQAFSWLCMHIVHWCWKFI